MLPIMELGIELRARRESEAALPWYDSRSMYSTVHIKFIQME